MLRRKLLIVFVASAALAQDRFEPIRQEIRKLLVEQQMPSLSVAVAQRGEILWEEAFGWADRENRIAATPHTMYSMASISKPITATGLMLLKERGKLDLDRPVNDYLGNAKVTVHVGNAQDVTVRRVANHSAGLPIHFQFFYVDEPYRRPSMDETIVRYGHTMFAPGERYEYSNLGYGILDHVMERVSGKPFEDFMREQVFMPLGLTHMSVGIGPGLEKQHAIRYWDDGAPVPFYDFDHRGASAVYASAHDLVRFGMFHAKAHLADQKAILNDAAIAEMQQPTNKINPTSGYGIGWNIAQDRSGYTVVSHTGGMSGVATFLRIIPSEGIVVVALANSRSVLGQRITDDLFGLLLPKFKASRAPRPAAAKSAAARFQPTPEVIGVWAGAIQTHQGSRTLKLTIPESGDVHVQVGTQLETLLNSADFNNGYLSGSLQTDVGTDDANRHPYRLHLNLKLRGDVLNGPATSISTTPRRNAFSYWTELKRQK